MPQPAWIAIPHCLLFSGFFSSIRHNLVSIKALKNFQAVMASVLAVEDLPCDCAYGGFPFGGYYSSLPEHWSGDRSTYYDNLIYGDSSYPTFVVEAPFTRDTSLARKRKLNGLKGEVILPGGNNVRNIFVKSGLNSRPSSPLSKSMRSSAVSSEEATKDTKVFEPPQGNAIESNLSNVPSVGMKSSYARVISIPVMSTNEGKANGVKCTVVPQQGTKKLNKGALSADGAAILVQAWFKGYQVRKTKPLTQLRCIAKVKLQLAELDERVSDADFMNRVRGNSAERIKLTESLMNLLLQLDAVQGTHPVVREIRKFTTKEVISLQERVDDLLTTEKTFAEFSQLGMEMEEASRVEVDWELLPATESSAIDSVTMGVMDVEEKEDPCFCTVEEGVEILRMSHDDVENDKTNADFGTQSMEPDPTMGNGDVDPPGGSLELMVFEAPKDVVENKEISYTMSTQMAEPDQDEGNAEVVEAKSRPELMEFESSKPNVEGNQQSVASDTGGGKFEIEQPSEVLEQHNIVFESDPLSESRHQDGKELEVAFNRARIGVAEEVEADTDRMNGSTVQSGDISEVSRQDNSESSEEVGRNHFDDRTNESGPNATAVLTDDGEPVHTLNKKHCHSPIDSSLPYSPRSPFEAQGCLDCPLSSSDSELPSESQELPKMVHEAPAYNNQALLLKLTEENKALKSLLVTIMKWNQVHAIGMQDVNQRLRNLEGRISPRSGKKKPNSRRRVGKNSRMPQ